MAAKMLLSSKSLAGARFTMVERAPVVKQVTNGSKYFMRRKGSFMVEVREPNSSSARHNHTAAAMRTAQQLQPARSHTRVQGCRTDPLEHNWTCRQG